MGARDLLYFNPDPDVQDADLLGIGDLIYSDGSTQYIPGNDPELIAGLPPPPPGVSPQGAVGMGPPEASAPSAQPMGPPMAPLQLDTPELGPVELDPNTGNLRPMQGMQDPNTGELLDPGPTSSFLPALGREIGNAAQGYPQPLGQAWGEEMGGGAPSAPTSSGPPPVTVQTERGPVTMDPTGNIQPGAGGVPLEQLQQQMDGMVPVQREGALPQDVAQRQMAEMQSMNAQTLATTEQARRDESRIYNELLLQQMAANDGERQKREQQLADDQARAERLQAEYYRTNDVQLDQSVRGAMGDASGTMGIIGAMLMGAAGNDQGWRWLDKNVDRFVNQQVRQKDSALAMLASQYGSTQQAIAAGKASLYKVSADRLELLAQKAKGDVYEAQTPAVLQQLRQKQDDAMKEFERLSLGKTLEKAPLPPKPPTPEQMQSYGELRREREAAGSMVQRVEQQLGLVWSPGKNGQPGHYANKQDVMGKGIQGVGNLEQLAPDLIYSIAGQAAAEGYQVRGAVEALAYAQVRQMQPTGPISNVDAKVGQAAAAMRTEEGLLQGLERLRMGEERQQRIDAGQYGENVVTEFNRRVGAAGGLGSSSTPAAARPATAEEKRNTSAQLRASSAPTAAAVPDGSGADAMALAPEQRMAMIQGDLQTLAGDELGPEGVAILVAQAAHETSDGARLPRNNFFGHKASGRSAAQGYGSANLETTEGEGAGAKRVRQNFATFPTSTASAADHISLLRRNYPRAWEALQVGDVDAYVASLKDGGYFTGNEDQYKRALLRRL
jgi:flagellum-specific peptidoglycan hydrolase FlgJ